MKNKIKTVYVIHHSHTDIGYTDLQERVIDTQVDYLKSVLKIMKQEAYQDFRWNCETLFCVEKFFEIASKEEINYFCELVANGKIGLSANYLNFNDLVDSDIYQERLAKWSQYFSNHNIGLKTAMFADINGISMGYRNAMIDCGVEFLYTNIHCHHGMYPLYENQNAFYWQTKEGKKILVWNGEHYNLGNVLGIKPNNNSNFMQKTYFGNETVNDDEIKTLFESLKKYLKSCEEQGYPYSFIISSVSGVFSDNAPPATEILTTINKFNDKYGQDIKIQMVSLQELYALIKPQLTTIPTYSGDLTDWWANGVGSTPYAVKHYRDALHRYHLCQRLDSDLDNKYPQDVRVIHDNLMLYAEHTWGHSSTITNPYDTMVLNLDMRKNSYASKAHEASSYILNQIAKEKGDILRYYDNSGKIKVCNVSQLNGLQLVEFYIETLNLDAAKVIGEDGKEIICQVSKHPRGKKISFIDYFKAKEEKIYRYMEIEATVETLNTRKCYIGSERVRDIVNDYDSETYHLPYYFENNFFYLAYEPYKGITSFVDKRSNKELLGKGEVPFFTPIYEVTKIRHDNGLVGCYEEYERRILGRNMRGKHAKLYFGELEEIICEEKGPIFTILRLHYHLEGSVHCDVVLKFYEDLARIDFKLELGKCISSDIESIFMPLSLNYDDSSLYLRKGQEAFRPGVDQVLGTCMEFYMSDIGLAYSSSQKGAIIACHDTPLLYMGELKHHPIQLCNNQLQNNQRPIYSWVMNNIWETNFKMDLSGFCEFNYTLWLSEEQDGELLMDELRERTFDPYVLIIE